MATVSEFCYDFGVRIGDPGNVKVESWQIQRWLNKAIRDTERRSNHLWAKITLSGQQCITVMDYSHLTGATISLKTSNDSAAVDYVEGVGWDAATSNSTTATNIATALNAHADVEAYACFDNANTGYAYVYVMCRRGYTISTLTCDATVTYLTIANAGYEIFELDKIISNFRLMRTVYDTANARLYVPFTSQQYDRVLCDSAYTGYGYYIDPLYKMYIKKAGASLTSADTFDLNYLYWSTALSTATSSPQGILQYYDELLIQKVLYYYYQSIAQYDQMRVVDALYRIELKQLLQELRDQGEPQEVTQFYQWH